MFTKTILLAAAAISAVAALPTATPPQKPTSTVTLTGVTHSVVAGRGGLRFDPENVVAQVGDVIEWHMTPKNHSIVQSSFAAPCVPRDATSFFSGFFPVTEGQSAEVFQVVVETSEPIWYYCAQGNHCASGMVGVVNQNFDGPNTLAKFRENAAKVTAPAGVQAQIQGGARIPNPNPLSGF